MSIKSQDWPFSSFQHVCIYVRDIDETDRFLRSIGIEIQGYPYKAQGRYLEVDGVRLDGDPDQEAAIWDLGYRAAMIGNVHLQFMSPGKYDTVHSRLVERYGNRANSIGFYVSDVDEAERELKSRGLSVLMRGRHENGWGWTYFDTHEGLGVNLCVRQTARRMGY